MVDEPLVLAALQQFDVLLRPEAIATCRGGLVATRATHAHDCASVCSSSCAAVGRL